MTRRAAVVVGGVGMTEIHDFWLALWHEAWTTWDGLWLFQPSRRPIERALGWEPSAWQGPSATEPVSSLMRSPVAS